MRRASCGCGCPQLTHAPQACPHSSRTSQGGDNQERAPQPTEQGTSADTTYRTPGEQISVLGDADSSNTLYICNMIKALLQCAIRQHIRSPRARSAEERLFDTAPTIGGSSPTYCWSAFALDAAVCAAMCSSTCAQHSPDSAGERRARGARGAQAVAVGQEREEEGVGVVWERGGVAPLASACWDCLRAWAGTSCSAWQ